MKANNRLQLLGKRFHALTVIKDIGNSAKGQHSLWLCVCDCINLCEVSSTNLVTGHTKSCGCIARKTMRDRNFKHGMTKTPTYKIWCGMIQRCVDQNHKDYHLYGGRGISVCQRWGESFTDFYADMGERPKGLLLDRIDNDGNYEPRNCRWVTNFVQANNRRSNHRLVFDEKNLSIAEWSRETGFSENMISDRLKHGWSIEETLTLERYRRRNHG